MSMRGDLSKIKELTINSKSNNMIVIEDKLNWDNLEINMKDTLEGTLISGKLQTGSLIHLWWLSSPQKEGLLEINQLTSNSSSSATIISTETTNSSSNMLIHLIRVKKSHPSQPFICLTSCIIKQIIKIITTTNHLWTQPVTTYAQQLTTQWFSNTTISSNSNTPTAIIINSLWSWQGTSTDNTCNRITLSGRQMRVISTVRMIS